MRLWRERVKQRIMWFLTRLIETHLATLSYIQNKVLVAFRSHIIKRYRQLKCLLTLIGSAWLSAVMSEQPLHKILSDNISRRMMNTLFTTASRFQVKLPICGIIWKAGTFTAFIYNSHISHRGNYNTHFHYRQNSGCERAWLLQQGDIFLYNQAAQTRNADLMSTLSFGNFHVCKSIFTAHWNDLKPLAAWDVGKSKWKKSENLNYDVENGNGP